MKKQISMTLAAVVFALSLTSCSGTGKGLMIPTGTKDKDGDDSTDSYFYQGEPEYDYKHVDEFRQLPSYNLDTVDEPWGEAHNLRMANGPIKNYFCYYTFDVNDEINNESLTNISTITRYFPSVHSSTELYLLQRILTMASDTLTTTPGLNFPT